MNIFEKMQIAKLNILKSNLKKSGENKFAGYKYYELADLIPTIIQICNEIKLFTKISFDNEKAVLTIVNIEKPDEMLEYSSPMKDLQLKGCNEIQALGGVETYQRRYLYMAAFDIIENDMFDGIDPNKNKPEEKPKKIDKATEEQIIELINKYTEMKNGNADELTKYYLNKFKVKNIKDLTFMQGVAIAKELTNLVNRKGA